MGEGPAAEPEDHSSISGAPTKRNSDKKGSIHLTTPGYSLSSWESQRRLEVARQVTATVTNRNR